MARYDRFEFERELKRVITRDRGETLARKILYDEVSEDNWRNDALDDMAEQAEYLFHHLSKVMNESRSTVFEQSVELLTDYHASLIASEDEEIWAGLDNKARNFVDRSIDRVGKVLKHMDDREYRDDEDYDYNHRSERNESRYRKNSPRNNSSGRDSYFERRNKRGHGKQSTGDQIGKRRMGESRYTSAKNRRNEEDDQTDNVISYDRKPRDFRKNPEPVPPPVQQDPIIVTECQLDLGFRYTPNLGQVAHFLYDIRKVIPMYEVISGGEDSGKILSEVFVHLNGERGRQIMNSDKSKGHSGYLFTARRGPRTDDTDAQSESITKVYRRLLQEPENIEDVFEQLIIEETNITAKPGAKLPTSFNRVPLVINERLDVGQSTTYNFPTIIMDHVEKYVKPVDPSFDVDKSILIATLVTTSPFTMVDVDEDTIEVKKWLRGLESRNNISAIVTFMHNLSECVSLRDWNYVNDQLTDVANQIAQVEFGIPVKITSFTSEIKQYVENIEQRFGRTVAEQFSDRAMYMSSAGLATYTTEDTLSFAYNTKVILLPIEACDLTIGLANADQATGIVSQANFPDLHDGLKKIIDTTDKDIAKILIILRDGTELTVHHSPIGNSILLHRKD